MHEKSPSTTPGLLQQSTRTRLRGFLNHWYYAAISTHLTNHPHAFERTLSKVSLGDPEVEASPTTPIHAGILVGFDLEQQDPIGYPGLKFSSAGILAGCLIAVFNAVGLELTLKFHSPLYFLGMAKEVMPRRFFSAEDIG